MVLQRNVPPRFLRIAAGNQVAPLTNIAGHCSDKETFVGNISPLDDQYFHAKKNHLHEPDWGHWFMNVPKVMRQKRKPNIQIYNIQNLSI